MLRQNMQVRIGMKTTTREHKTALWTDFEEDCDAVNQARASKINDGGYSACQRVFGRNPHRWKMPFFLSAEEQV